MSSNYKVYVFTSDIYLWSLRPFFWLMDKYWEPHPEVVVCGFSVPSFGLPDYARFYSVGNFSNYPRNKWSDAVIKFLQEVDDDVFVFMLEDYFLCRPVNSDAVDKLAIMMHAEKNIGRIDLTTDRLFANGPRYPNDIPHGGYCGYMDLIRSEPGSQYHLSLICGLWRREALLESLVPGESAQDTEINGTSRLSRLPYLVLGTRQWPVRHGLAFRVQNPGVIDVSYLCDDDRSEMDRLGLLKE